MQRFIARRVVQSLGVLVVLALVVFALARVTGNPADLLLPGRVFQQVKRRLRKSGWRSRHQNVLTRNGAEGSQGRG